MWILQLAAWRGHQRLWIFAPRFLALQDSVSLPVKGSLGRVPAVPAQWAEGGGRNDEVSVSRLLWRFLEHWYYGEAVAEGGL